MSTKKGVIGILTGGGDVPGLNPAIRAVTIRALREGYKVIGIRHGWLGASIVRLTQVLKPMSQKGQCSKEVKWCSAIGRPTPSGI